MSVFSRTANEHYSRVKAERDQLRSLNDQLTNLNRAIAEALLNGDVQRATELALQRNLCGSMKQLGALKRQKPPAL